MKMGAIGMMAFNEVTFRCVCISERRVGQPGTGHCRELGEAQTHSLSDGLSEHFFGCSWEQGVKFGSV